MNKIIQINLAGQAVSIDELAYESLSTYLKSLKKFFKNTDSGEEILTDIEFRMAELFHTKLKGSHTFIDDLDVAEAVELMGTPEEMGFENDDEFSFEEEPKAETTYTYSGSNKKLFRDSEDKVLGGVCSGLAAYFGIDTSVMRLITLLIILFTGIGLVPYLILWIVLPQTKTPQDRFRMHGETPNINEIADNIRNEAREVADNLKKNSSLNSVINGISQVVEKIVKALSKIFGAGALSILVVLGIALSAVLLANATGTANIHYNGQNFAPPHLFDSPTVNWIFSVSLLAIVLLPIGTICFAILQYIFNMANTVNLKSVFLAWLLSLAVFVSVSIYAAGELNIDELKDFKYKIEETNQV